MGVGMCGCFGNMCTCIYCVFLLFVLCFCIVSFMYIYSYLLLLYWCKDYCRRVTTQLQLVVVLVVVVVVVAAAVAVEVVVVVVAVVVIIIIIIIIYMTFWQLPLFLSSFKTITKPIVFGRADRARSETEINYDK